jgi:hypothetical protein
VGISSCSKPSESRHCPSRVQRKRFTTAKEAPLLESGGSIAQPEGLCAVVSCSAVLVRGGQRESGGTISHMRTCGRVAIRRATVTCLMTRTATFGLGFTIFVRWTSTSVDFTADTTMLTLSTTQQRTGTISMTPFSRSALLNSP